jgi:hypothetical protein
MALQGNTLKIIEADNVQFTVIKSWNKMRWNKSLKQLEGTADLELLDKLSGIVKLPPAIENRRQELHRVQEAVDMERINPNPTPMVNFPVKLPLYKHQVRGANMALITFGLIQPNGGAVNG